MAELDSGREFEALPDDLPVPVDDGAADHLLGMRLPVIGLPSTAGEKVRLDDPAGGRTVVFCYPRTGRPGEESIGGNQAWNAIPGARGCTPHNLGYRASQDDFARRGVTVYGLSVQGTAYQQELVARLDLGFAVLSDADLVLTRAMALPTFQVPTLQGPGQTLLRRLSMVIDDGVVTHVHYPVFPPDRDAEQILSWLDGFG